MSVDSGPIRPIDLSDKYSHAEKAYAAKRRSPRGGSSFGFMDFLGSLFMFFLFLTWFVDFAQRKFAQILDWLPF